MNSNMGSNMAPLMVSRGASEAPPFSVGATESYRPWDIGLRIGLDEVELRNCVNFG